MDNNLVLGKDYFIYVIMNPNLYMSMNIELSEEDIKELKTKNAIEIKNKSNKKVRWFLCNSFPEDEIYMSNSLYEEELSESMKQYMEYCINSLGLDKEGK